MKLLAIIGLIFNTIGSIVLAYSLSKTINMLDVSITALEHFKDSVTDGGDIVSFRGLETHRKNGFRNSKLLTLIGLFLIISGFVLQLLPLLL